MNQATEKPSAAIALPMIAFRSARLRTWAACLTMAMCWIPVLSAWFQANAHLEASNGSISMLADAITEADDIIVNGSSPSKDLTEKISYPSISLEEITDARLAPVSGPQGPADPEILAHMSTADPVDRLRGLTRAGQLKPSP